MNKQERAIQLLKETKYEEAAKLFIELIEENPKQPVYYINFGNLLFQMRQFEEAERFFLKAIHLDERAATAYYGLGNVYYETELYEEAEKMFQQSIRLGLQDSDVYYMLGMTYVKRNNLTLSLPFLQRGAELSDDIEKLFQYGFILAQLNYLQEAEKILLQVIQKQKDHADALYNLAIIEVHHQSYDTALQYIDKALRSQPNHQLALKAKDNIKKLVANE